MCLSRLWPQVFVRAGPGLHTSLKKTKQFNKKTVSFRLNSVVDPWHFDTDPAPEPAVFVTDLQDGNKKLFYQVFRLITF
jgi:hypothetical protein